MVVMDTAMHCSGNHQPSSCILHEEWEFHGSRDHMDFVNIELQITHGGRLDGRIGHCDGHLHIHHRLQRYARCILNHALGHCMLYFSINKRVKLWRFNDIQP